MEMMCVFLKDNFYLFSSYKSWELHFMLSDSTTSYNYTTTTLLKIVYNSTQRRHLLWNRNLSSEIQLNLPTLNLEILSQMSYFILYAFFFVLNVYPIQSTPVLHSLELLEISNYWPNIPVTSLRLNIDQVSSNRTLQHQEHLLQHQDHGHQEQDQECPCQCSASQELWLRNNSSIHQPSTVRNIRFT